MTDFSQGAAWIRGDVVPIAEATIGVTDWALTHSDAVYDVVPVWNGGFFRLPDYLTRFQASVAAAHMQIGMDDAAITDALNAMVGRSGLTCAYVSMTAARGTPRIPGNRDPRDCANHFYAWCVPYVHVVKPEVAEAGIALWLSQTTRRIPPDSVNPHAKNYHWGDFTAGLFEAKERGFESVLLPDHDGNVTEGPGFNVFALKDGTVVTPRDGVLRGITRQTVLEMARCEGFETHERALPIAELLEADDVFLSTSAGGVVPVARIGERVFSNGAAGETALRLRARYYALLDDPAYRTEITYE